MAGRSRTPHRFGHGSRVRASRGRVGVACALAAVLLLAMPREAWPNDPARTATIYIQGFEQTGAARDGVFGEDLGDPLLDSVVALAGLPVANGEATLPANVVAMTSYYGDTPPPWFTPADRAELDQVTAQWGGGVPRYALIAAKYARHVLQRSGAEHVNFVSASFGSLIVRWLIEKDVGGLASSGRIARWLSIEGLLAGNWAASRDELIDYLDFLDPFPVDVDHMNYAWVSTHLHDPRAEADHANYAGILIGQSVSTDDDYNAGALSTLMRSYDEWQPNDGVQAVADAVFQPVTARSRFLGRPPTLTYFRNDHFAIQQSPSAWAQVATFLTQRRRVTVTMTIARVADLHEPDEWYWDWRPAEVLLESRVVSPAVAARWGVSGPVHVREKEGAVAPLRRFQDHGESQSFTHVLFDDLVLDEEKELRISLRAEEVDYDWRYGVFETAQAPYYDDLGAGTVTVSTLVPGTYTFQAEHWSCTISVSVFDYPFAAPVSVPGTTAPSPRARLRVSPNPHGAIANVTLEGGVAPSTGSEIATLHVLDVSGRVVRRMTGDARAGFRWDGRDGAGAMLPAGVYLLRVTTPRGSWSTRSALVR